MKFLVLCLGLAFLNTAWAQSHSGDSLAVSPIFPTKEKLFSLEGVVMFELEGKEKATYLEQKPVFVTPAAYEAVRAVEGQLFQRGGGPASFAEFLDLLKAQSQSWSREQKDLYLMIVGGKLGRDPYYDHSVPKKGRSGEEQYQRIKNGQPVGSCTHLHRDLLVPMVEILYGKGAGYKDLDAGMHTTNWKQGDKPSGGHGLLYFRDPDTQKIRVLNYGILLNTNTKRVDQAVLWSSQAWAPLSTTVRAETLPGEVKLLTTPMASSLHSKVRGHLDREDPALGLVNLRMSNKDNAVSVDAKKNFGDSSFSTHVGTFDYRVPEGSYRAGYLGVGYKHDQVMDLSHKKALLDQVRVTGRLYGGVLAAQSPELVAGRQGKSHLEEGQFYGGADLKLTLRHNNLTGEVEVESFTMDSFRSQPANQLKTNLMWEPRELLGGLQAGWQQVFEWKPHRIAGSREDSELQKSYDRLYLNWRGNFDKKGTLSIDNSFYFLETEGTAMASRHRLIASRQMTEQLSGYVAAELSKVYSDGGDPFYRQPGISAKIEAGLDYQFKRMRNMGMGVGVSVDNGHAPFYEARDRDSLWGHRPDFGREGGQPHFSGWLYIDKKF